MEIIIGREPKSRKLCVNRDGKLQFVGAANSVPLDVSRQHVYLYSSDNEKWEIRNLNDLNVTYVNGIPIECKEITEKDKIEIGASHFLVSWEIIRGPKVETVDISHLKPVWENYKESTREIEDRQKNANLLARVPMVFTMLSSVLGGVFLDKNNPLLYLLILLALATLVYSLYVSKNDTSREEKEELVKELRDKYVCPKCGRYFGPQDYEVLIRQTFTCPKCKCKYKV